MQITPKTLHLMQQVLRCIVYVGIAHGLYYLVPAIALTIVIAVASKK